MRFSTRYFLIKMETLAEQKPPMSPCLPWQELGGQAGSGHEFEIVGSQTLTLAFDLKPVSLGSPLASFLTF